MFNKLKKHFRKSIEKLSEKREEKQAEPQVTAVPEKQKKPKAITERFTTKELSEKDIDRFFDDIELDLLQSDVALEVVDFLRSEMKKSLEGTKVKRRKASDSIKEALRQSLLKTLGQGDIDIEEKIRTAKNEGRPACFVFLGFNGSGKTTTIARIAYMLKEKGHRPVLAAGDTFRAAAIEQLEIHGEKLGIKVIKHQYGADSAAVIFDAVKYAKSKGHDIVLADTAGRMHTDKNLMDELSKVVRVNRPDLKILVIDSLTGNDAVEQAKKFHETVGVDAVIMTKVDVNEKGGSILSVSYAIKKPIIFIGTGQAYSDIKKFRPEEFVNELLG